MKRQRVDQSALHQDAERSSFFFPSPFSSWHTGKVCEILFEVHRRAHFKVRTTPAVCILPEIRSLLSGGTMENQPGKNARTHRTESPAKIKYVHVILLRRNHAHYLMSVLNSSLVFSLPSGNCIETQQSSSKALLGQKSQNVTSSHWQVWLELGHCWLLSFILVLLFCVYWGNISHQLLSKNKIKNQIHDKWDSALNLYLQSKGIVSLFNQGLILVWLNLL